MKKQSDNLFETMSNEKIQHHLGSVNETLSGGFNQTNNKVFTAVDLWNIQRNGTSSLQKRHSF